MIPKKYHILIDCEFTPKEHLCYNIGGLIIDNKGNVVREFNFLVQEVFLGKKDKDEELSLQKKGKYFDLLINEKVQVKSVYDIMVYIENLYKEFNIDLFMSYNLPVDLSALNKTSHYYVQRNFLVKDKNLKCLQKMAEKLFYNRPTYKIYCEENNLLNTVNEPKRRAKDFYGYITGDTSFKQQHTALADCYMELEIFKYIKRQHKKF